MKSLAAGVNGKLAVVRQVMWREATRCLVNQNGQLQFSTMSHWQPVKLPQDGCDVLSIALIRVQQSSTGSKLTSSVIDKPYIIFQTLLLHSVFTAVKVIPLNDRGSKVITICPKMLFSSAQLKV